MNICDNCIHLKVCGHENVEDEAMTYCADKEERPNEFELKSEIMDSSTSSLEKKGGEE